MFLPLDEVALPDVHDVQTERLELLHAFHGLVVQIPERTAYDRVVVLGVIHGGVPMPEVPMELYYRLRPRDPAIYFSHARRGRYAMDLVFGADELARQGVVVLVLDGDAVLGGVCV
jgi:hypothetical protein